MPSGPVAACSARLTPPLRQCWAGAYQFNQSLFIISAESLINNNLKRQARLNTTSPNWNWQ